MSALAATATISAATAAAPMIEARGLVKRFGRTVALDGLDLVAESGQVVAVLGPNGAGKTTFVRAIATLLTPDHGSLRVAGHDVLKEPQAVFLTRALLWAAAIVAVSAPIAILRYRRS